MKKRLLVICLFVVTISFGQDLHYSQITSQPLYLNPGACGILDGWERVSLMQRTQWLGSATKFSTTSLGAEFNLGKSDKNDVAYYALGIQLYNDIGGDSDFGSRAANVTFNGILPTGKLGHTFALGMQMGYGSRTANLDNLQFMSQWDGVKFDDKIKVSDMNMKSYMRYIDANAGFFYMFDGGRSNMRRHEDFKIILGLGAYHLNRPVIQYITAKGDTLHRKFVLHGSILKDIDFTNWSVELNAAQFVQGPHRETMGGLLIRQRFGDGTKVTGVRQESFFGFGSYYRWKESVSPAVLVEHKGFKFSICYDITISTMRSLYGGSLEFSLMYSNLAYAAFKPRNRLYNRY